MSRYTEASSCPPKALALKLNYTMKRTRVALVKDSKSARKSLALFELCQHRPRAVYLGR
jgi:hypothetical protein